MAGQKRSSIPKNFSLPQQSLKKKSSSDQNASSFKNASADDLNPQATGVNSDFDLHIDTLERIKTLARERGVSCERLLTDVIDAYSNEAANAQDKRNSNIYSNTGIVARRKSLDNEALYPLRFIDPSDMISPEEDFRELNS